jgi:toxin ParE1/3/4
MQVIWSVAAVRHLTELRRFIAEHNPEAAAGTAARILEAVETLASMPHMGRPGRLAGTRELVVTGTPYIVPYRVRADRLEILAVLHTARRWPPPGS